MTKMIGVREQLNTILANVIALRRKTVEYIWLTGRELARAKALLGPAYFSMWIGKQYQRGFIDFSPETASNYVALAEWLQVLPDAPDFSWLNNIRLSGIYLLAAPSTPYAATLKVIELARSGPVTVNDVKNAIDEARARQMAVAEKFIRDTAPDGVLTRMHLRAVSETLQEIAYTGAVERADGDQVSLTEALRGAVTKTEQELIDRQRAHISRSYRLKDKKLKRVTLLNVSLAHLSPDPETGEITARLNFTQDIYGLVRALESGRVKGQIWLNLTITQEDDLEDLLYQEVKRADGLQ